MRVAVTMSAEHEDARYPYDFLRHNYIVYLQNLGFVPVLVPNGIQNPEDYLTSLGVEGLVLTGGGDVDPARYGQENTASNEISPMRDETEFRLMQCAVDRHFPVLAICRGMQFMNVFFGGSLIQDIPTQVNAALDHRTGTHSIHVLDSRIEQALGIRVWDVNTYHHQGVHTTTVAPGLDIFATTEDNIVEGILHPAYPIIGVQWHPERPSPSPEIDLQLIRSFLDKAFWK